MSANAEQQARTRAKRKASGTFENAKTLLKMQAVPFAHVQDLAEHVCDFGGLFGSANIANNGTITVTISAPIEYAQQAQELAVAARVGAVFFRAYVVTPEAFFTDGGEDAESAGE